MHKGLRFFVRWPWWRLLAKGVAAYNTKTFQWPLNGHTSWRPDGHAIIHTKAAQGEFQWPLNGHTSWRPANGAGKEYARDHVFQWPLNGHSSWRRYISLGGDNVKIVFQWPPNGHTSWRQK